MQQRTLLPIAIIFLGFLQSTVSADNVINVDGDRFRVNGKPYDMWGIRVAIASQSQDLTDELIANLDDYRSWCQGPSSGQPVRYDLGGDGTSTSPGIRWYFEHVRRSIENDEPEIIGVGNS